MELEAKIKASWRFKFLMPPLLGLVLLGISAWNVRLEEVVLAGAEDWIPAGGIFQKPCGAINQHGQTVIPFCYTSLGSLNEFGLAIAKNSSGHVGCVNRFGEVVIPFEWDRIQNFDASGRAWASRASETTLIDTSGRIIESYPFSLIPPFNRHGLARCFEPQSRWRLVNRTGEVVSPAEWNYIEPFDEQGFAVVCVSTDGGKLKRFGIINEKGHWHVEPIWLEIFQQRQMHPQGVEWPEVRKTVFDSHGWCLVKAESGFGWIDRNGSVVSPLKWKCAWRFTEFDDGTESLARVSDDSGTGFINRRGDIVIPTTFVRAGLFDAGGLALAAVGDKDHQKLGWINKTGEFVIPPEWDDVRPFAPNGLAQVSRNGLWGCIDREGRIRVEPRWYSVSVWNNWCNQPWRNDGIHVVSYSPDQWLILDNDGQEIQNLGVPPKCRYDPAECERFDFGFIRFYYRENKTGRYLHRTALKLPRPVSRIASKITEPLNKWSLEYEVLDNSGTTIWSSVQSENLRRLAKLLAIAGGICLVWSFGQSSFIQKFRLRGTFSNRPCGDSEISERCVEEVASGMSEQ